LGLLLALWARAALYDTLNQQKKGQPNTSTFVALISGFIVGIYAVLFVDLQLTDATSHG